MTLIQIPKYEVCYANAKLDRNEKWELQTKDCLINPIYITCMYPIKTGVLINFANAEYVETPLKLEELVKKLGIELT